MFANIIFPAFHAPYFAAFLPPVVVATLLTESAVLYVLSRPCKPGAVFAAVTASNVVSWIAGLVLTPLLFVPDGLGRADGGTILGHGPDWDHHAASAFLQACVLSVVIEYLALLPVAKVVQLRQLALGVLVGNVVSYVLVFASLCWFVGSLANR